MVRHYTLKRTVVRTEKEKRGEKDKEAPVQEQPSAQVQEPEPKNAGNGVDSSAEQPSTAEQATV